MKRLYFLLILICFFSCQKERSSEVRQTNTPQQVDVYVAGYVSGDVNSQDEYPTYWKNGIPVQLKINNALLNIARAHSIAVSGNDVYVTGYETVFSPTGGHPDGLLWKNGAIAELDSSFGNPPLASADWPLTSLTLSGNDVYVVQDGPLNDGQYWRNTSRVQVPDAYVSSIAISGTDVYLAGTSFYGSPNVAKYWKNGIPVNLTDGSLDAKATSIVISGTDVYVAGYEYGVAKYWKNGVLVNLTDGLTGGEANSIAVYGTDVYVAGTQWEGILTHNAFGYEYRKSVAKYWKNGNPVNLTDGTEDAEARSVAVSGNDVYVAGYENNGTVSVAKYWKNGTPIILGDVSKYSEAYSIFLAKH